MFWYEAVVKREAMLECVDTFVADMEEKGLSGNVDRCHTKKWLVICLINILLSQSTYGS